MCTEKTMDHSEYPRNVGEIENPSGVRTVGSPKYGDVIQTHLSIDENQIVRDVRFKTFDCGAAVMTSSMATELVKGRTVQETIAVTSRAVMGTPDGLPPVKIHRSLLAEGAVHATPQDYVQKNGITVEDLEKPKDSIEEEEEEENY